jgi:hypothetical protein
MAKFPETEWRALQVRLTIFPTPDGIVRAPEWWQHVTGREPDHNSIDRKRDTSIISGELEDGKALTLILAPERIDWIFAAVEGVSDWVLLFEEVAPLAEAVREFSKLAERWLAADRIPGVARMAFGVVLSHSEADPEEAYRRLGDYLPVSIEPTWRDFWFQINVPKPLDPNDYGMPYLNRLSRWNVIRADRGMLVNTVQGAITRTGAAKFALRLEVDVNTPGELAGPLDTGRLVPLYRELAETAAGIARDGVTHEQYRL